jgi:parallel beta-helix repeat protein
VMKSNVELCGIDENATIKLDAEVDDDMITNENYSTPDVDDNIVLRNLILDANRDNQTDYTVDSSCVRFRYIDNCKVYNCTAKNAVKNGFIFMYCEGFQCHDNHIHHCGTTAVNFRVSDYASICRNRIHDIGSKTDEFGVSSGGHSIADFASGSDNRGSYKVSVQNNISYDTGDSCLRNNNGQGWTISNNIVFSNGKDAIKVMINTVGDPLPEYNTIANNIIIDAGNDAIRYNGKNGIIKGNLILGTGKNLAGEAFGKFYPLSCAGIQLGICDNVHVSDNMVIDAYRTGIRATAGDTKKIWIANNIVTESGEDGIRVGDANNIRITGNIVFNNQKGRDGQTMTSAAGIRARNTASSSNWYIKDNYIFDDQNDPTQQYGIFLQDVGGNTLTNLIIKDNDIWGNVTAPLLSNYVPTKIRDNTGYITESSGTATIASGDTHIDVTHGLAITPEAANISVTPTNSMGDSAKYYISDIGATTFRINVNADPGATTATFAWQIN